MSTPAPTTPPRERRRLKVVVGEDAGRYGASVTDVETGKPLGVTSFDLHWDIKSGPTLTVTTHRVQAEIGAGAWLVKLCPGCHKERLRELEAEGT